jgi:hypothetical protein
VTAGRVRVLALLASCTFSAGWCAFRWRDVVDHGPSLFWGNSVFSAPFLSDRVALVLWALTRVFVAVAIAEIYLKTQSKN